MDNIDRKILTILQQNARTPLKVIAEQVFLSSPAVSARIERLEAAGYILGYQAQLSCAAMGYPDQGVHQSGSGAEPEAGVLSVH